LVPPAKSVTLSNLHEQATRKKLNCIATVTMAHIARLFSSTSKIIIIKSVKREEF
jgi:hypothetical protein